MSSSSSLWMLTSLHSSSSLLSFCPEAVSRFREESLDGETVMDELLDLTGDVLFFGDATQD
jgi:hypothetical protein